MTDQDQYHLGRADLPSARQAQARPAARGHRDDQQGPAPVAQRSVGGALVSVFRTFLLRGTELLTCHQRLKPIVGSQAGALVRNEAGARLTVTR
jgi:hypothetical protein